MAIAAARFKKVRMKDSQHRDAQFENIGQFKAAYRAAGNPVISMDTKKKEYVGQFYRDGSAYTQEALLAFDHDFNSFADGIIIPHGVYDLLHNKGYINLGTRQDSSEFACDCLRNWWYNQGQIDYPQATSILILCDGGGSNNARHAVFKADLQPLANEIAIEIRIAHYPPYTSKYNPIEHRLFPHVTRACQAVLFKRVELVKNLMECTRTRQKLSVVIQIVDKVYQTGRQVAEHFKQNMPIIFDEHLSMSNYRAVPNDGVI
jgi:Rhodopirellula transposase DDE domain